MKLIAISGWKRSGKDTAAEYLINNKGYTRVSFADPLKDMVAKEYDIPRHYCDDPQFKEAALEQYPVMPKDDFTLNLSKMLYKEFRTLSGQMPMEYHIDASGAFLGVMGRHVEQLYWTPRALCILKGSVNRAVDSSYWVGCAIDNIRNTTSMIEAPDACGPDTIHTRFVISDLRYRSEVDQLRQAFGKNLITVRINRFDSVNSTDPSENDLNLFKFDVTIENKGSIEEFLDKVNKL